MPIWKITNKNKYGTLRSRLFYSEKTTLDVSPGFGNFFSAHLFKYEYCDVLPPHLIVSPISGKKFIIPSWIEVLPETTLDDIEWVRPTPKKIQSKEQPTIFKFKSSSSDSEYIVRQIGTVLKCSCPGFWRAKDKNIGCKHMQEVRKKQTK